MKKTIVFIQSLCIVIAFCAISIPAASQSRSHGRSIYGELLGPSQGLGISYDARIKKESSEGFGWRTGAGVGYEYSSITAIYNIDGNWVDTYNQMFRLAIPIEVNYLLGKGRSKFESGAGGSMCVDLYRSASGAKPKSAVGVIPYVNIGYRYVADKGFMFRIGVSSSYSFNGDRVVFYPYIGFGKEF